MATGDSAAGGVLVDTSDGGVCIAFWGVVDAEVRTSVSAQLHAARLPGRPCEIDCRAVTLMDSIGLSVFVRLVRDMIEDAQNVRFLGASSQVADLLETTGVVAWMRRLGVQVD